MNMRRLSVHIGLALGALCLAFPGPGAALTKQEVRERSLKRLERVSEKVKSDPSGEDPSGVSLGRSFPAANATAPQPVAPPPPAPARRTEKPGRAAERRADEAVIAPVPASQPAATATASSAPADPLALPADAAQPAQAAQIAPLAPAAPVPGTGPGQAAPATAAAPTGRATVDPANRRKALELFQQALAAAKKDNHKKALDLLSKAADLDPTDPDIFNNRGNAHNNLGDLRKALADYDTAVSLRPADAASLSNRGLAHERLGDDAAACRDYRTACDLGDCEFYESFRKEGRCPK
jgi:hypothetical protein